MKPHCSRIACALVITVASACGQAARPEAAFEAASIKQSLTAHGRGGGDFSSPGVFHVRAFSLKDLIRIAYTDGSYRPEEYQVVGGPDWLDDDAYDVVAKSGASTARQEMRQMIQTLLAERFGLVVHREIRRFTGYALVIGKGAPRMQRVSDTETARGEFQSLKTGEIVAMREPMADWLLSLVGRFTFPWWTRPALVAAIIFRFGGRIMRFPQILQTGLQPMQASTGRACSARSRSRG